MPPSPWPLREGHTAEWAARLGILLLLVWALVRGFGEPTLASPDRGDFYRVGTPAGLVVPKADLERRGALLTYELRAPRFEGVPPSASLVVLAARALPGPDTATGPTLDVRQVGFLYTVLLGAAVVLALRFGLSPILGLLFTWASLGPARLAVQNSLLTEPASLVALTALAALLAGPLVSLPAPGKVRGVVLVLVGFALLGGFARAPASLLPLTLVVALAFGPRGRSLRDWRGPWGLLVLALVACLPAVHAMRGDAARFRQINVYHAVFRGVALVSSQPGQVLSRLGVGATHASRVGSSYFDGPVPEELTLSLERVSRLDVAVEYLREPGAVIGALRSITRSLGEEWAPWGGEVRREIFEWWSVSSVHSLAFGAFPALLWLVIVAAVAFCIRPRGPVRAAALFLGLSFVSQLVVTVLGDGLFALGRHLVLARAAAQLLILLALWDGGGALISRYASKAGTPS